MSSIFFRFGLMATFAHLLAQVPVVDLHVTGLVHHLAGRVQLPVEPGHRVHELAGDEERALLSVEELGEGPADVLDPEPRLLLLGHLLEERVAGEGVDLPGEDTLLQIDVRLPGEQAALPLVPFRLLVEIAESFLHRAVVPGVGGVEGSGDLLDVRSAIWNALPDGTPGQACPGVALKFDMNSGSGFNAVSPPPAVK
jgi:hypothetical protein